MSARDRIRQTVERWFLVEPLLFAAWTTHNVLIEPRTRTLRIREGRIEYNPEFIDSLDPQRLEMVLRAEAVRILLKHPYQRRKENAILAYTASNITLQENLHLDLPFPSAQTVFNTPDYDQQYFEFYYNKLQELAAQAATCAFGGGQISEESSNSSNKSAMQSPDNNQHDDPSEHAQAPSLLEQYTDAECSGHENTEDWDLDDMFADRINDTIRQAQETNQWGSVAGNTREQILATLHPKLDYRSVLRAFRASITAKTRILTRMKPSRRYGFLYMGSRHDLSTRLLFAVDVSGSISSDDLERGFSVINRFFNYGVPVLDMIQFDTDICGKAVTLKKARRTMEVVGRGGTDFAPVISYIDEHPGYDGVIIFTDGQAPVPRKPKNYRTRVLWLFNHQSAYTQMHHQLRHIGRAVYLKTD